jgi:hypothetical protein
LIKKQITFEQQKEEERQKQVQVKIKRKFEEVNASLSVFQDAEGGRGETNTNYYFSKPANLMPPTKASLILLNQS